MIKRDENGRFVKGSKFWLGKKRPNMKRHNKLYKKGCAPWNKGISPSKETKEKISKGLEGNIPWNKGKKIDQYSGEKHWNWQGGISEDNYKARHTLKYKQWRDSVYKRDNWTCTDCDEKLESDNIIAHHIKRFSKHPELRFDVKNGKTLCRSCHAFYHSKNHRDRDKSGRYTKETLTFQLP